MKLRTLLVAALLACCADGAFAQGAPDGYSCTVQAFSNIGGLHAVGEGEVTLRADAAFNATGYSFTYRVRDRVSGLTRLHATWGLADRAPDGLGPIQSFRLPFHSGLSARPASIAFSFDGGPPAAVPTQLSATGWIETAPDGRISAIAAWARNGPIPELRGRRMLGYAVAAADGARLAEDLFLLPDWRRQRSAIRSAASRAGRLLRRRDCNPFYVLAPRLQREN